MTRALDRDPLYRGRQFHAETIEQCVLGLALRAGIRKALGATCPAGEFLVANGRDVRTRAWRKLLPI